MSETKQMRWNNALRIAQHFNQLLSTDHIVLTETGHVVSAMVVTDTMICYTMRGSTCKVVLCDKPMEWEGLDKTMRQYNAQFKDWIVAKRIDVSGLLALPKAVPKPGVLEPLDAGHAFLASMPDIEGNARDVVMKIVRKYKNFIIATPLDAASTVDRLRISRDGTDNAVQVPSGQRATILDAAQPHKTLYQDYAKTGNPVRLHQWFHKV